MTTFAGWLADQRKRDDAVGWFARYWRDLPETPRLSSPASIGSHLEDRTTKPGQNKAGERLPFGFTDPDGGNYVRDAYDATLHEYRQVRAEIAQSAAAADGVPGAEAGAEPQPASLAGQAVERATQAAQAAVQRHAAMSPGVTISSSRITSHEQSQLDRIEAKLDEIRLHLGLAITADRIADGPVTYPEDGLITGVDWAQWYAVADLSAAAE